MLAGELNKPGQKNTKIDKYSSPGARCKKQKGEREGDMEKGGRRHQRKRQVIRPAMKSPSAKVQASNSQHLASFSHQVTVAKRSVPTCLVQLYLYDQ